MAQSGVTMSLLHQRQQQQSKSENSSLPTSVSSTSTSYNRSIFSPTISSSRTVTLVLLFTFSFVVILGIFSPWAGLALPGNVGVGIFSNKNEQKWRDYSLKEAIEKVAVNRTVIVCAVSQPYLPFLNNWLISISRHNHQQQVLVIAEDYATLFKVNQLWPGHAVLIPPVPDSQTAHRFGSQGFFNFTSRRPRHLLEILDLGYQVMYNDVDMVWLADPFPFFKGNHDIYFTDDMTVIKPFNHSNSLPPPGKKGRTYICSCMIFLRPTSAAKLVLRKWIEEMEIQPWSKSKKANDQPAFNWALNKTANQVSMYLLPQYAFPSGGLYFKNETWRKETEGKNVIVHNNYIIGFDKKIKRFHEFGLWLVDKFAHKSPLSGISITK